MSLQSTILPMLSSSSAVLAFLAMSLTSKCLKSVLSLSYTIRGSNIIATSSNSAGRNQDWGEGLKRSPIRVHNGQSYLREYSDLLITRRQGSQEKFSFNIREGRGQPGPSPGSDPVSAIFLVPYSFVIGTGHPPRSPFSSPSTLPHLLPC